MLEKMLVLDKLASKEDKVVLHDSIPAVKSEALETNFHNPVNFPTDLDSALKSRAQQPPLLQYTMDQLDTLEFDDHANLWKEYINRCGKQALSHVSCLCSYEQCLWGPSQRSPQPCYC